MSFLHSLENIYVHTHLFLGVRSKPGDELLVDVGPQLELVLPLLDTDAGRAEHQAALLDGAAGGDANQSFARTAGQHDNAAASATRRGEKRGGTGFSFIPIAEHLGQALLLI